MYLVEKLTNLHFPRICFICFIIELLVQHEFCCVNLNGRRCEHEKQTNNTHIPYSIDFQIATVTSWKLCEKKPQSLNYYNFDFLGTYNTPLEIWVQKAHILQIPAAKPINNSPIVWQLHIRVIKRTAVEKQLWFFFAYFSTNVRVVLCPIIDQNVFHVHMQNSHHHSCWENIYLLTSTDYRDTKIYLKHN